MNKLILGYNGINHNYLVQNTDDTGEDLGGGNPGDGEGEEEEALEEGDESDLEDGDEEASGSESEEEGDDEGSDEEENQELGNRAKKRIDKLLSRSKSAEARVEQLTKELETAKKLGGDDGKSYMAAAEKSGILPGLMTKNEAEAFRDLEDLPVVLKRYKKWINTHDKGDELEIGGDKTMSYGDVVDRMDELSERLEDLKTEYGERRKELQASVKELFELGVAAKKAGWAPDKKRSEKTNKAKTKPSAGNDRREAPRRTKLDDIEVTDGDSLEAYMAAMRRNKKKED